MESDADLIRDYLTGDDTAFAELVHRHGPMVLAMCLRILGSRHDAEDAFQATFIVLARRASTIHPPSRLPAWLYGVARRVALKARGREYRRRAVEARISTPADQSSKSDPDIPENLWAILDEELARLPETYLTPFILCDLEGITYREAARQLGIAEGTLSNRLASARRKLASGLTRRGIVLPASGLAAILTPSIVAAKVPHSLAIGATELALAPESFSPLAEGVLRTMFRTQLIKMFVSVIAVIGVVALGGAFLLAHVDEKQTQKLDGDWTVVRAERDGKLLPDNELKMMKVTIASGTLTVDTGKRQERVGIRLDATTTPKSIDIRPEKYPDQIERGIYKFDGDQLTICWGAQGAERPKEFKTSKGTVGRIIVLQKAKNKK